MNVGYLWKMPIVGYCETEMKYIITFTRQWGSQSGRFWWTWMRWGDSPKSRIRPRSKQRRLARVLLSAAKKFLEKKIMR